MGGWRLPRDHFNQGWRAARRDLAVLAVVVLGPAAAPQAQERSPGPPAAAAIRQATPAEVKARLDADEAAIAAEPAFDGLDKRLSHYIRTTLPTWAPLSGAAAPASAGRAAKRGQASPFICRGDFDGNGLQDTAAMMKERSTGELRLMAFHQVTVIVNPGSIKQRGYQVYDVMTPPAGAPPETLEIACKRPGRFTSAEGDVELKLKNDSLEASLVEYYFSDGAYRSLVIGD